MVDGTKPYSERQDVSPCTRSVVRCMEKSSESVIFEGESNFVERERRKR